MYKLGQGSNENRFPGELVCSVHNMYLQMHEFSCNYVFIYRTHVCLDSQSKVEMECLNSGKKMGMT